MTTEFYCNRAVSTDAIPVPVAPFAYTNLSPDSSATDGIPFPVPFSLHAAHSVDWYDLPGLWFAIVRVALLENGFPSDALLLLRSFLLAKKLLKKMGKVLLQNMLSSLRMWIMVIMVYLALKVHPNCPRYSGNCQSLLLRMVHLHDNGFRHLCHSNRRCELVYLG